MADFDQEVVEAGTRGARRVAGEHLAQRREVRAERVRRAVRVAKLDFADTHGIWTVLHRLTAMPAASAIFMSLTIEST